jgi:NDMA-dependent alcohol dehydrogenase
VRIRAAVLREVGGPLHVEDLELDPPAAGEVLVKLAAVAICGSDVHYLTGLRTCYLPSVRGHEGAGIVEKVGEGVSGIRPGDHVVTTFVGRCGRCRRCRQGRPAHCEFGTASADGTYLDGSYRLHDQHGTAVGSGSRLGLFATHAVIPAANCVLVPADLPLTSLALLSCGVTTGLGAALNSAAVRREHRVVVVGVGGVGLASVAGAAVAGAKQIIAVDTLGSKRERALAFGATHFVDASTHDVGSVVADLTEGEGADIVLVTVDTVTGPVLHAALDLLGPGGSAVMVGLAPAELDHLPYPPGQMLRRQLTFTATLAGGMDPAADVPRYIELYREGRLRLDEMVSATFPLDRINDAIAAHRGGHPIRTVIALADAR